MRVYSHLSTLLKTYSGRVLQAQSSKAQESTKKNYRGGEFFHENIIERLRKISKFFRPCPAFYRGADKTAPLCLLLSARGHDRRKRRHARQKEFVTRGLTGHIDHREQFFSRRHGRVQRRRAGEHAADGYVPARRGRKRNVASGHRGKVERTRGRGVKPRIERPLAREVLPCGDGIVGVDLRQLSAHGHGHGVLRVLRGEREIIRQGDTAARSRAAHIKRVALRLIRRQRRVERRSRERGRGERGNSRGTRGTRRTRRSRRTSVTL